MKKILIFSHGLAIGGAERALLGLLETIDTSKFEVDLFLMHHDGELMKFIPKNINLLPVIPEYDSLAVPMKKLFRNNQWGVLLGRLLAKIVSHFTVWKLRLPKDNEVELEYSHKYTCRYMPKISEKEYDLAISFLTPHYFVVNKVNAKKRLAWIHTDYSKVSVDVKSQEKMWSSYDNIISISESVTNSFLHLFPNLKDKILLIENIMPVDYIRNMAEETLEVNEMSSEGIKLLSIGRFCVAKNFDNIPAICRLLIELGCPVSWYIIGYGEDEALIKQKIAEHHVEDYVFILGKRENPYPYIKMCDIYVQPSRYEGKCVSVIEAQILHKPVIITNYSTASSQLENGKDGVIVPLENEDCAAAIKKILQDEELQNLLVNNTYDKDYSNVEGIKKIYGILE